MTHILGKTSLWLRVSALGLVVWITASACAMAQGSPSAEARLKELNITLPSVPPLSLIHI